MPLVLSLFPGIGLLDRAFEEEGFCVVRGPDLLWGGDIRAFHPPAGVFDGVIGGPPCQAFSRMRHLNPRCGEKTGNLIPEFSRCVSAAGPSWFLMENVPDAPSPDAQGYYVSEALIEDCEVGGQTRRTRRFSFGSSTGSILLVRRHALWRPDPLPAVMRSSIAVPVAIGGSGKRKKTAGGARRGGPHAGPSMTIGDMLATQGFPPDLLDGCPLTSDGKRRAIGNGVPLAMGRAIARAVKAAIGVAEVAA